MTLSEKNHSNMDENFRKRLQKTLYCGELEPEHCPLALTELAVEYFQDLAPNRLDFVDLESASLVTSQDTVSPSSMAMSMMYAKRLQRKRPEYIGNMSSSDLFIISMMMASKYLCDEGLDEEVLNDEWAKNTGLDTDEVNKLEMDFLDALDWEMYIKKEDFSRAILSIEKSVALRQGLKRNWFTYTDMYLLLDDTWANLSGLDIRMEWLQLMVVSSAAYFAGIMTMVGSTALLTNACVGLSSSGLLPGLNIIVPSHPSLTHAPLLCHGSTLDHQVDISPPDIGLSANESESVVDKEKNPSGESWMPGQTVVDTILSQLMAVLTLKSHLSQFVYAVSDSYSSQRDRNQSERKGSQPHTGCRLKTEEKETQLSSQEISAAENAVMLRLLGMNDWSAELNCFVGSCFKCGRKGKTHPETEFTPAVSCSQWYRQNECWKCGLDREWMCDLTDSQCWELCQRCRSQAESSQPCWNQARSSMHGLFTDVTVGFSTSMPPPVYAT